MEYYNRVICVTYDELTQSPDGISEPVMSVPNYKQLANRGRLNMMRKARGLGSYALIEFESLPERFKQRFVESYGDPAEVLRGESAADTIRIDTQARDFYEAYLLPDGNSLPIEKIEEYTINASVLNEVIRILNDRTACRKSLGGSTARLWDTVAGTVEKFRTRTNAQGQPETWHTLPANIMRLKGKINDYKKRGYASLISRKFCNDNTLKITEEAGKLIIALRRSRVPVYTVEQIFEEYNRIAPEREWKPLKSVQSLRLFLNRPEIEPLWYDAVYGELAAKQRYQRKHKTVMPTMRDSLWYADGTKLNLYYKAYDKDGKWTMKTTQVYEVIDAYSEVLLGYHISDSEDFRAQYNAFRMAIGTAGHRPYEIVTDNQGGHKKLEAGGFFDRITGHVSRRTAPYNPQSKSIEALFGRFQSQILRKDWRFTGQNITTKTAKSRPNLEFVLANQESLYTLEELKVAYAKAREEWNLAPHPATGRPRIEMYRESINPDTQPVGVNDMVEMFWIITDKPSTFTSAGITISVTKKKYTYEVLDAYGMPDMEFRRKHTYRQFRVMYDPQDMTKVKLYEQTPSGLRFAADAVPYLEVQRNIQEQKPGDMAFIRQQDIINKQERINRQLAAAQLETEHGVAPEQHGLNRPRLKGLNLSTVEGMMLNGKMPRGKRSAKPAPVDIGLIEKAISNRTYETTSQFDKI